MNDKNKKWFILAAILLSIFIILLVYFMFLRSRQEDKYESKLVEDVQNVLDSGKIYTVYVKEDGKEPLNSQIEIGFDFKQGFKIEKTKTLTNHNFTGKKSIEIYRDGKRNILVMVKKPVVLKHELDIKFNSNSLTANNDSIIRTKKEIESEILKSDMFTSLEKSSELAIRTLLEAYGYGKVEIEFY